MIDTSVERGGAWIRIVLNAPPGNVLSFALVSRLRSVMASLRETDGLKWLTIEGAGADFSFGASIAEHSPADMPRVLPEAHRLLKDLLAFPRPTAALVQGRCLGGGFELALACDVILASADASLGLPEINLGAFPPGGAALLAPRVGSSRAARTMLTGEPHPAEYWHDAGLLSLMTGNSSLVEAAGEWFDRYCAPRSAIALAHVARAARIQLRAYAEPALDIAEAQYLECLLKTADAAEGVQAWLEKRPPQWQHK